MRFLYRCRIQVYKDSYNLNCKPLNVTNQKARTIVFRGTEEAFKKFLMRVKAKDTQTEPASVKNRTYQQMIDQAKTGLDPYVYIWSNNLPSEGAIREDLHFFSSNLSAEKWLKENLGE